MQDNLQQVNEKKPPLMQLKGINMVFRKPGALQREKPQKSKPHHHHRFSKFRPGAAQPLQPHRRDNRKNRRRRRQRIVFNPDQITLLLHQMGSVDAVVDHNPVPGVKTAPLPGFQNPRHPAVTKVLGKRAPGPPQQTVPLGSGRDQCAVAFKQNRARSHRGELVLLQFRPSGSDKDDSSCSHVSSTFCGPRLGTVSFNVPDHLLPASRQSPFFLKKRL